MGDRWESSPPERRVERVARADGGTEPESLDDVFSALDDSHRRYLLYYLQDNDGAGTREGAAARIAAWQSGTHPEEVSEAEYEDVLVVLHHVHLPRLRSAGLVTYDRRHGDVAVTDRLNRIASFLDAARDWDGV